jgi:hypothetical protein
MNGHADVTKLQDQAAPASEKRLAKLRGIFEQAHGNRVTMLRAIDKLIEAKAEA